MDNQENTDSSNKADSELERHQLTVNGKAEAIGMIAVNSANPDHDEHSSEEKKKKEQGIEEWLLSDEIAKLKEYLDELNERIDAGTILLDAYKNGERDFDSVQHLQLLETTGWSKEDILEGRAENTLQNWKQEHAEGLAQLEMFKELDTLEPDAKVQQSDRLLTTSIETAIDLKSDFQTAAENTETTQPNEPEIVIPAPGQSFGF